MSKKVKTIKEFLHEPENFRIGDLILCKDTGDVEDFNSSPGEIFLERVDENIYEIKETRNEIQNSKKARPIKKAEKYKKSPSCDEEISIKFDFESNREFMIIIFVFLVIAIGFIVLIIGMGDGNPPANPDLQSKGILIIISSLILFELLKHCIDDYLLINPKSKYVLLSNRILFFKKITRLCPFKDVEYVKLDTVSKSGKGGCFTVFFLQLVMKNDKKKSTEVILISEESGYQFNDKVAKLRKKALRIANTVGCKINYSQKIPPEERLQPKKLHEKSLLKESEKKEFSNIPHPVESREVDKIPMDNIQSDFLCYEEDKICPSCGERNSQNKYCNNCGTEL